MPAKKNPNWHSDPDDYTKYLEERVDKSTDGILSAYNLFEGYRHDYKREGMYQNYLQRQLDAIQEQEDEADREQERKEDEEFQRRIENRPYDQMEDWEQYPGHKEDNLF